ncbi:EthD family reductase [Larsenimonas rhizosphaerae]|uniref:EthD family reductase n=1 Tax=Larsenimonas rhizosphaerae TaxID=2944682 RepID=A0AA41ZLC0_9GAMM|nr:EthD family reductase [Larsenimonas rhizosphaerae]MCM2129543.1 EthD family reductase [Larsenimonas rhizosphaerae]MCX2524201.1 EthD family reductase [Larsenimonas rhizosphaerae]
MSSSDTVTLYIVYTGHQTDRFDRDYYVNTHLPMVRAAWQEHGLLQASALFPAEPPHDSIVAVAVCVFKSESALQACLDAPATGPVTADVSNFTDLMPGMHRTVPLFTE